MNLTKFGSSHEKFDVWPKPKSLIERPSPSQEYKVDYLAAYAYSRGIFIRNFIRQVRRLLLPKMDPTTTRFLIVHSLNNY